ncbi:hypothetical protein [Deinococcus xianganensis]|uniref:Uncharacterized protein n=1 Tax=Deinococcus xianganensis TaxID=1507289 RepID=A0A6I4YUH6_9DEIO|nr:hypothetical protein [Deinococcus xianganensis]MXV21285.1 hypothetical protein [Deinococcus xianganensis]
MKSYWDEFGMDYAVDVMQGGFELTFHAVQPDEPVPLPPARLYPVRAARRRQHLPALQARLTPSRQHLLLELWHRSPRPGDHFSLDDAGRLHLRFDLFEQLGRLSARSRAAAIWNAIRPAPAAPYRLSPTRGTS